MGGLERSAFEFRYQFPVAIHAWVAFSKMPLRDLIRVANITSTWLGTSLSGVRDLAQRLLWQCVGDQLGTGIGA